MKNSCEKIVSYFILIFILLELTFSYFSLNYIRFYDQPPETGDESWALDFALTTIQEGKPQTNMWLGNSYNEMGSNITTPWVYILLYGIPMKIKGSINIYLGRNISFIISIIILILIFFLTRYKTKSNFLAGSVILLPLLNYNFLYASHSCRGEILLCLGITLLFYLFYLFRNNFFKDFLLGAYLGICIMGAIGFPLILALVFTMEGMSIFESKREQRYKKMLVFISGFSCVLLYLYFLNGSWKLPHLILLLRENYPSVNIFVAISQFFHFLNLRKFITMFSFIISTRFFLLVKNLKYELLLFIFLFIFSLLHFQKIPVSLPVKKTVKRYILFSLFSFFSLTFVYFFIYPYIREIYISFFYISILLLLLPLCELFVNGFNTVERTIWSKKIIFYAFGFLLCIKMPNSYTFFKEYLKVQRPYKKYYSNQKEIADFLCEYLKSSTENSLVLGPLIFYQYLHKERQFHYVCYERYLYETYPLDEDAILNFLKNKKVNYWILVDIDYNIIIKSPCFKWNDIFNEFKKKYLKKVKVWDKEVFYYGKRSTKVVLYKVNFKSYKDKD